MGDIEVIAQPYPDTAGIDATFDKLIRRSIEL